MKKFLAGLVVLFVLFVSMSVSADAQKCRTKRYKRSYVGNNRNYNRNYNQYYNQGYTTTRSYTYQQRPSFYRRNRNFINIAAGTGAGALIGGILGGKKGVLIGSLVGAGGSALYTYKINPKKRRYYRR